MKVGKRNRGRKQAHSKSNKKYSVLFCSVLIMEWENGNTCVSRATDSLSNMYPDHYIFNRMHALAHTHICLITVHNRQC